MSVWWMEKSENQQKRSYKSAMLDLSQEGCTSYIEFNGLYTKGHRRSFLGIEINLVTETWIEKWRIHDLGNQFM